MIEFIYVNQSLNMGIRSKPTNYFEREVSEKEQELIFKYSTRIEDFHFLSFGAGCLMINNINCGQFRINPSSGLVDIFYLINFYCEPELRFNYCVEEFYTVNESDDEYCVSIKSDFLKNEEVITLKNNNQMESYSFDYHLFKEELVSFSNHLIKMFLQKYPILIGSPMLKIINEKLNLIT